MVLLRDTHLRVTCEHFSRITLRFIHACFRPERLPFPSIAQYSTKIKHLETNLEFKSDYKIISSSIKPFYFTNKNTRNNKPIFIKYTPQDLSQKDWNSISKL